VTITRDKHVRDRPTVKIPKRSAISSLFELFHRKVDVLVIDLMILFNTVDFTPFILAKY